VSWSKIDDRLHGHPKAHTAGLPAMGLWVLGMSWSAAYEPGHVSREWVRSWRDGVKYASRLEQVGFWLPDDDGWTFHDWSEFNPTAEQAAAEREAARIRQQRHRASRRDGSVTNGSVMLPRPDPTRPGDTWEGYQ
jgi:hypothetical protein